MSNRVFSKQNFTIDDMVELGDGCRSFIYQAINAGELRAVKRGRRTIILAEDRAAWRASWPPIRPKDAT
jgi:hypothetical protein